MTRVSKVAISLPEDVLDAVERERQTSGESRSEFFRRAAETLIKRRLEQELSERYVRAYQETPETPEEIAAAEQIATAILAEEPW